MSEESRARYWEHWGASVGTLRLDDSNNTEIRVTALEYARILDGRKERLHWVGPRGERFQYSGKLNDLGFAIPCPDERGFRRFLRVFAHGYSSGFPLWHVVVFSYRDAFMPKTNRRRIERNRAAGSSRQAVEWVRA